MQTRIDEISQKYKIGKGQAVFLLIVLLLLYIMNSADRSIFSIALQPMQLALQLSDTEVGFLQSAFFIGVGLLSIPASILVDRWSRRKSIGLMALIWSIATFATGICNNFIQLIFVRFTVGVGEAAYFPGGMGWLSVAFSKERRARVLSIYMVGAALGVVLGSVLGGLMIARTHDWRSPFFIFAIPGIILGITAFFLKDYATIKHTEDSGTGKSLWSEWLGLFKIKSFTAIVIGQSLWALFYQTFLGWLVIFIMRGYNIDTGQAGLIVGGGAVVAVIATIFAGWITDVWRKRNKAAAPYMMVIAQGFLAVACLAAVLTIKISLPIYIVIIMLTCVPASMVIAALSVLLSDVVPIKHRATGAGLESLIAYIVGASLGPWLAGMISDAAGGGLEGLKMGFLCLLPALFLAFICYLIMARKMYVDDSERCSDYVVAEQKGGK